MDERIEIIRNRLMKTKPHEVWQADIKELCDYLICRYNDFIFDDPRGNWTGFKGVKTDEYVIHEQGRNIVCKGLLKDKEKGWMIEPVTGESPIPIKRIRIIASYAEITKALLDAVDKVHYTAKTLFGIND